MFEEPRILYALIIAAIVVMIAAVIVVRRKRIDSDLVAPRPRLLPPGWQFYDNPTTLDPPGTIFRISGEGRRFIVTTLDVRIQTGETAFGQREGTIDASTGMVGRFFGARGVNLRTGAKTVDHAVFALEDVTSEQLDDASLDQVLKVYLAGMPYRADFKYFVIREALLARRITHTLDRQELTDLGGEAPLAAEVKLEGTLFKSTGEGKYTLERSFPTPMRVLFLPEEIKPVSAGLANFAPQLGLAKVTQPLFWTESIDERAGRNTSPSTS